MKGFALRFDDSLATVLAGDAATVAGAQAAWRQLVDLAGRGRVPDLADAVARLRALRDQVPATVRAASTRALAWGQPPAALVGLFAEDEPAIAAPVLRAATLSAAEWLALLPRLSPAGRAVLRHRRDLPDAVSRGLASFGAADFVLAHDGSLPREAPQGSAPAAPPPSPAPPTSPPIPFRSIGEVARAQPVVREALRQAGDAPQFEIADLVARIDAFRRDKPAPVATPSAAPDRFEFHTDAAGAIRWVEGVARGPLIGVSLKLAAPQGCVTIGATTGRAVQAREPFRDVALQVDGDSGAAGTWRLSGVPRFDRGTGDFVGMAGTARRTVAAPTPSGGADTLRQLVHELRTPANAMAGFAELIDAELIGPVPPVYRERARLIRRETAGLVSAVEDLDWAARVEHGALQLRPAIVDLASLVAAAAETWRPIASERGAQLTVEPADPVYAHADARASALLIDRLIAAAVTTSTAGERVAVHLVAKARTARVRVGRPRALAQISDAAPLASTPAGEGPGGPLLGPGFTLQLVRDLAAAVGGSLRIAPERLTLRLPAAVTTGMEQATTP